jgi:hypothetical protein
MLTADYNAVTDYEELRIELLYDASRETFSLRASSPAGQMAIPDFPQPVSRWEVEEAFAGVMRADTGRHFLRSVQLPAVDTIRTLGGRLFNSLGDSRVANLYYQSSARAREAGKCLRIRLVMNHMDMALLPWEFLFDPERQDFIILSTLSPVVRQWQWPVPPQPSHPLSVEPPLRVLVVIAEVNPWDSGAQKELAILENLHTTGMGLHLVEVVRDATPHKVREALGKHSYNILHLILSAVHFGLLQGWEPNITVPDSPLFSGQSLLLFADETDPTRSPQTAELPMLFSALRQQQELQFVCFSGDCTDWLASQATSLSPATLGWRGTNTMEAYLSFTKGFYAALVNGQPLEAAVTYGRQAIDADYPGGKEWGMPVFYLQTPQGCRLQPERKAAYEVAAKGGQLSQPPADPARQRDWKRLQALLAIAQQNYQSLQDEKGKYPENAVPQYMSNQVQELEERIKDLESKLEQLQALPLS